MEELKECGWSSILGATMELGSISSLSYSDLGSFSVKRHTSSIWSLQTHKTKLTSMVYQSQPRCSRHFRINKEASFILTTRNVIIIQPLHVSQKYVGVILLDSSRGKTGVSVPVDRARRHCCHHWCLIGTVPEKIHIAWPLALCCINGPDCFKWYFVCTPLCNGLLLCIAQN